MNHLRYLATLYIAISLLFFACSPSNDSSSIADKTSVDTTKEESVVVLQTEEKMETNDQHVKASGIPNLIEWNPPITWEEFAIGSGSDVFPDKRLNNYAIWDYDLGSLPVILLISNENDFMALSEPDDELDEGSFKVAQVDFPLESGFANYESKSYTYYDFFQRDIDTNGTQEYVISAEINGMAEAHDDDGMRPVHYLKSAVFTFRDNVVAYSKELSDQYNKEVGTVESDIKEPHASFLYKKYYNLDTKADGLEKSALLRTLVDDMGIAAENQNSDTRFGKVDEMDDAYVVYASFVGSKYFVSTASNTFSELKKIDEDFYPLMLDHYQMSDIYSISSARVEKGEVRMTLRPLPESEAAKENIDIDFSYNEEHWTLISNSGNKWFPETVRKSLHKIQDD